VYRCRFDGESAIVKLWTGDLREVAFYQDFASRLGIRTPKCFSAASEDDRAALVLEDLDRAIQGDCLERLDVAGAKTMARMLATLHATWWERPELASLPIMSKRDREWLLTRREEFLKRFADRLDATGRRLLESVEAVNARAAERLADAPQTLLHADLHLDNVLFDEGDPVLIDWARVARGPAAIDVVELIFSMAPEGEWRSTLGIYVDELRRRGVAIDDDSLHRQIGGALLRRFISATCGISRWEPDSERERQMVDTDLRRTLGGTKAWRGEEGGLFEF